MTDRPIPFSPLMVRAILREIEQPGTGKTQTRRVLAGKYSVGPAHGVERCGAHWIAREYDRTWPLRFPHVPGDRLWVKEAWWAEARYDDRPPRDIPVGAPIYYQTEPEPGCAGRYRHGKFMCRWMSRITLLVTEVRLERLQDISEEDAVAEGWPAPQDRAKTGIAEIRDAYPIGWYAALWESLHGPGSWEANPWAAVYGFRPVLANIDQTEPTHD